MEITFKACEHLDYEPHYGPCKRQMIACGETKLCWKRPDDLVQFCKKRGRINNPIGCLSKDTAACPDFNETTQVVDVSKMELDS